MSKQNRNFELQEDIEGQGYRGNKQKSRNKEEEYQDYEEEEDQYEEEKDEEEQEEKQKRQKEYRNTIKKAEQNMTQEDEEDEYAGNFDQDQEIVPLPKQTVCLSVFLLVVGIGFLIGGVITYFQKEQQKGLLFIIFGGILSVPGFYYSFKLIQAARASPEERKMILEEIPE